MNHDHTITLAVGKTTVQVELGYTFSKGAPATREQPEEGDSAEIMTVFVIERDGRRTCAPTWLFEIVEEDDDIAAQLLAAALIDHQSAADDHADMLREERMLDRD